MALMITDRCINCGYCVAECPNSAIYEPAYEWSLGDGTELSGSYELVNGNNVNSTEWHQPLSKNYYYIVPEKCAECEGLYENPQCKEVCPDPDSIIMNPKFHESKAELTAKQSILNGL